MNGVTAGFDHEVSMRALLCSSTKQAETDDDPWRYSSVPYDERLADRLRDVYASLPNAHELDITEKKMFGGLIFMVNGKMTCGVGRDDLMVRVGPDGQAAALRRAHVTPMEMKGRPMNGYVTVAREGCKTRASLVSWVTQSLAFVETLSSR
jgi:TfoX/Sxy family transcriptional regulator of competence genes